MAERFDRPTTAAGTDLTEDYTRHPKGCRVYRYSLDDDCTCGLRNRVADAEKQAAASARREVHKAGLKWALAERDIARAEAEVSDQAHAQLVHDYDALAAENAALREALTEIKDTQGRVCSDFEVCSHASCRSSYTSWAIADKALANPAAARADAARLREHAHDWRHAPFCDYERDDGPCSCGLAHAQAPNPDADKWLAERDEREYHRGYKRAQMDFASDPDWDKAAITLYLATHPNLLDLDSPETERRLSDALPHGLEARPAIAHHVITALRALSPTEQPADNQTPSTLPND